MTNFDWTNLPTPPDNYIGNSGKQGEYISALEKFRNGPVRTDYSSESAYTADRNKWFKALSNWANTNVLQAGLGTSLSVLGTSLDFTKNDKAKTKQIIQIAQKALDDGLIKNWKHVYEQDRALKERLGQKEEAPKAPTATETAAAAAKAQDEKIGLEQVFALPDVFGLHPLGAEERRAGVKSKDISEAEWNTYIGKLVSDRPQETIASLKAAGFDVRGLSDPAALTNVLTALGQYASEVYLANGKKKIVNPLSTEFLKEYRKYQNALNAPKKTFNKEAAAQAKTYLADFYNDNGVAYTDAQLDKDANAIGWGDKSATDITNRVRESFLVKQYPEYADQIKAGHSIREIANPYIAMLSNVLEIPDQDIKVMDKRVQNALRSKNADGTVAPQTLNDFELSLRQDPRWAETNNGRSWLASTSTSILQTMGLM